MKFVASVEDGPTTYVVAVDRDGFTHLETRWTSADDTVSANEVVLSEGAAVELIAALKGAMAVV